ncbi:tol-pal system YbgF family protein [Streptomyces sp. NPDC005374]|uniref:tetratricopeptide repeat protein n=1 Tax=Streptomyces sp. NPDC005374 TaxID=3364713 RepID=UPI0036965352
MSDPTYALPTMPSAAPDEPRAPDPVSVALGNASLLGVGYLMLRRRRLALAAVVGSAVLVLRLVTTASPSYEVAVLVWWAAVVGHGWFLARGGGGRGTARRQRLVALGITLPVLLVVGLLRFDAFRIGRSVTEARESGDCARVSTAQDSVWFGHRVADAPLTARGDEAVAACDRLRTARAELSTALTGDTEAMADGFGTLASVLAKGGNEKTVEATLNGFLGRLPAKDPCDTAAVTDWLRDRGRSHDVLDRAADTAALTAPAALVGCGDDLLADDSWQQALAYYQRLLDRYPGSGLADRARKGARKATLSIELANVRSLLSGGTGTQPEYCSRPAKYSGAKPMGKGTNRALFYASDLYGTDYSDQLPGSWKAGDATDTVLVVCMGEAASGPSVETCPYRSKSSGAISYKSFTKIEIPVKVYELRTGKPVADRKIQINGTSCPSTIYAPEGTGSMYLDASTSDVRSAFRPLVVR